MGGFTLFHWLFLLALVLLPAILVWRSPKVGGYDKVCWMFVAFFLSWLGLLVFLVVYSGRPALNRG
jgi:hypothetical protein